MTTAAGRQQDPGDGVGDGALTVLDRDRCLALLASRPVGRLVFSSGALPDVLPVNYRLAGGDVVFRLGRGSRAAQACRDAVVAFQVDAVDPEAETGWSVVVVGRSREVTDGAERAQLLALPLRSWLGESRDMLVRVALDRVTGREVVRSGSPSLA